MDHDKSGNPVEKPNVPDIVDKLGPVQLMSKRRAKLDFLRDAAAEGQGGGAHLDLLERRIYMDALEYVEHFSEDAFCRIMAYHALGRRA